MLLVLYLRTLPIPGLQRFSSMFSSKSFVALHFVLRSVIPFEFIFVYGVWCMDQGSFFCLWIFSFSSTFVEEYPFHFYQKSVNYICVALFLVSILFYVYSDLYLGSTTFFFKEPNHKYFRFCRQKSKNQDIIYRYLYNKKENKFPWIFLTKFKI